MADQKITDFSKGDKVQLKDGTVGTIKRFKPGDGLHVEVSTPRGIVSAFFNNLTKLK